MIDRFDGEEHYRSARDSNSGAVLVTAHMGSFEVGLASLASMEDHIHVVFKRDASGPFEAMRTKFRRSLGIVEAPIEDGMSMWVGLRKALDRGELVVMQIDRAMPGQATVTVPVLHGHLRIPTGGLWLARLTSSPIVPVFVTRTSSGRFAIRAFQPIDPGRGRDKPHCNDPTVSALVNAIELMVREYPTQWLNLRPVFVDDCATLGAGDAC